jgi:hypothetical protein
VFVQLKRAAAEGKVVYVPPSRPLESAPVLLADRSNGNLEVKKLQEEKLKGKRCLWTSQEDAYIAELYNAGKPTAEVARLVHERFPVRNAPGILKRLQVLQTKGVIGRRGVREEAVKGIAEPWAELKITAPAVQAFEALSLKVAGLEKSVAVLQEAYDAQSKAYVDLRSKIENALINKEGSNIEKLIADFDRLTAEFSVVHERIAKHKHAQGSGEAMLPVAAEGGCRV